MSLLLLSSLPVGLRVDLFLAVGGALVVLVYVVARGRR